MLKIEDIARGVFISPPEEVLHIVRCIECCHWNDVECEKSETGFGHCEKLDMMTNKAWWCGRGER